MLKILHSCLLQVLMCTTEWHSAPHPLVTAFWVDGWMDTSPVLIYKPKTRKTIGLHYPPLCNFVLGLCVVQVLSKGHLLGPAGVEVKLSRVGTEEKLQSVITQPAGK